MSQTHCSWDAPRKYSYNQISPTSTPKHTHTHTHTHSSAHPEVIQSFRSCVSITPIHSHTQYPIPNTQYPIPTHPTHPTQTLNSNTHTLNSFALESKKLSLDHFEYISISIQFSFHTRDSSNFFEL